MKTTDGCEFTRDGTKRRETSRRRTGGTSTLAGDEKGERRAKGEARLYNAGLWVSGSTADGNGASEEESGGGGKQEGVKASVLNTLSVAGRRTANQRWSRSNPRHRRLCHLVPRMAEGTLQRY